jgi:hypothetical protein
MHARRFRGNGHAARRSSTPAHCRRWHFALALLLFLPLLHFCLFSSALSRVHPVREVATTPLHVRNLTGEERGSSLILTARQALLSGDLSALWLHTGYGPRLGMWNAMPYIRGLVQKEGYEPAYTSNWTAATLLIEPNYWRPHASDWRKWRLLPYQRINRIWGIACISSKEALFRTLDSFWGRAGCPFAPETYVLEEVVTSSKYAQLVASKKSWLIKTAAHRGQGIKLVSSPELLRITEAAPRGQPATRGQREGGSAGVQTWLRTHMHGALLQAPITRPLLIDGRKVSLRLYSLITCAAPLRVYLHDEGFALFASHRFNGTLTGEMDPYSFLTNAAVNAHPSEGAPTAATSPVSADARLARSLSLAIPEQRWELTHFLKFVEAREEQEKRELVKAAPRRGSVRRALEKLVLQTFVAARPELARAMRVSLDALALSGAHEYGATFELAAFDVMLDADLKPWLLEVNTSPSLKKEGEGDLELKLRMMKDMLSLSDAIPDTLDVPPEAELAKLLSANQMGGAPPAASNSSACIRRWRLGDCRYCPTWGEASQLWRAIGERRRAGGFMPLAPSADPVLIELARQRESARAGGGRAAAADVAAFPGRPSSDELLVAWFGDARDDSNGNDSGRASCAQRPFRLAPEHARQCIRLRWEAMLCPPKH